MPDLVVWLETQLDRDEQEIRRRQSIPPGWVHDGPCVNYDGQDPEDYTEYDSCSRHIAAAERRSADPFPYRDHEFGLRQVLAYRRVLTAHRDARARALYYERDGEEPFRSESRGFEQALDRTVRMLMEVYSDRDGFDPSWRTDG